MALKKETKVAEGKKEDLTATTASKEVKKEASNEKQEEQNDDQDVDYVKIHKDDVKGWLREQLEEMKAVEAVKVGKKDPDAFDKDDYLEVPAFFFCFRDKHSIYCDKKAYGNTEPPRGRIQFKSEFRTKEKTTKGERAITVSKFVTRSKAEAEWLRQHEDFGRLFFEELEQAMGKNAILADRMASISSRINKLSDNDVINRCNHEGITIGNNNISSLRKQLIDHLVKKETEANKQGFLNGISTREFPVEGKINEAELAAKHKGSYE